MHGLHEANGGEAGEDAASGSSLSFTHILDLVGLRHDRVRLVRHQDRRGLGGETPFHLWVHARDRFDAYQAIQKKPIFRKASHSASFVATPDGKTLFVGLYEVMGVDRAAAGERCPLTGIDVSGFHVYSLRRDPRLDAYVERLVIDWGPGARSWAQWAGHQRKPVLEITTKRRDPDFPGFLSFCAPVSTIPTLYPAWEAALASVRGVYVLSCPETGELYIGSATGEGGFVGRWREYAKNGHGGNAMLKNRKRADYRVSILEIASSSETEEQILRREAIWKVKLGTRAHGLNAN